MSSGLKIDVLGVTETHWSVQHRKWEQEAGGRFLCGSAPKEGDKAAGVGLVLSQDAANRLTAWGTCEVRITV